MSTSDNPPKAHPRFGRTRRRRIAAPDGGAIRTRRLAFAAGIAAVTGWLVAIVVPDSGAVSHRFVLASGSAEFVVPADVCRVHIEAAGASGGLQGAAGTLT